MEANKACVGVLYRRSVRGRIKRDGRIVGRME
jgi:hypothetical protein